MGIGGARWPVLALLGPGLLLALGVWLAGQHLGTGAAADDPEPDGAARAMSPVTFGKYQRLALCVQAVEATEEDARAVRQRLREAAGAFVGIRPSAAGAPSAYALPPIFDVGCPAPPTRLTPGGAARRVAVRPGDGLPPPSPYHVHLFIVSRLTRESLQQTFRFGWSSSEPEEYVADNPGGQARVAVTGGLYTSLDELARPSDADALLEGLWRLERAGTAGGAPKGAAPTGTASRAAP